MSSESTKASPTRVNVAVDVGSLKILTEDSAILGEPLINPSFGWQLVQTRILKQVFSPSKERQT